MKYYVGLLGFVFVALQLFAGYRLYKASLRALDKHQELFPVDYVGLLLKPTCVTRRSIQDLIRYQKPRYIYIITPQFQVCEDKLQPLGESVRCIEEGAVLPGVTKDLIADKLTAKFGEGLKAEEFQKGRTLAGWYLQQILKLGVALTIPDLSQYYVIWDFDMIPVRRIPLFWGSKAALRQQRGGHRSQLELHPHAGTLDTAGIRTTVNIGGVKIEGYEKAYRSIFGHQLHHAPDGTSFVSHWIVVQKQLMEAFLAALTKDSGALGWIDTIIENIPEDDIFLGFSEYASYVSWVMENHPDTQYIMPRKTWMRQPLGGDYAIRAAKRMHPDGLCCPTDWQSSLQRLFGYDYYGFEIGHKQELCRWTDPAFRDSYAL